ncbi:MAG: hypothetical protein OHK0032_06180 [Thermodesulfovibrionales bacterium]
MDIRGLIEQIKLDCNISDAGFWGYYSICGLLLRLRELYRDENSLLPWAEIPREDMSVWIASREAIWKTLENKRLMPLRIDGRVYDPFEIDEINAVLGRAGLIYGGGYGRFNKPAFFLARLKSRRELYDYHIYYAGDELCRDLSSSVAMLQGRCIFMRLESLKTLLWEKFQELRSRRFGGALKEAFSSYGIEGTESPSEELYKKIGTISDEISELFILHELGEAVEDYQSGEWLGILSQNRDRLTEFYMRGIKDLLSDTSDMGPLKYIANKKERYLLNFYMIFLDGIRKEVFPEIMDAYQRFIEGNDWTIIENARIAGYKRAMELREYVLRLWKEGKRGEIGAFIKQSLRDSFKTSKGDTHNSKG